MQFKLFSIPATGDAGAEEELNRFLRSHRAVSVHKELVNNGDTACWCFCLEYLLNSPSLEGKAGGRLRVDYKELLSADDFTVFVRLREVRKQLAGKEAIPVYAVCTNEQSSRVGIAHHPAAMRFAYRSTDTVTHLLLRPGKLPASSFGLVVGDAHPTPLMLGR